MHPQCWTRFESDALYDAQFNFFIHASEHGDLRDCGLDGVQGTERQSWKLQPTRRLTQEDLKNTSAVFLTGCLRLVVPEEVDPRELIKKQLVLSINDTENKPVDCTGIQIGPLIDEIFAYDGPLGCQPLPGFPQDCEPSCGPPVPMEFALWAPTAVQVDLVLAEDPKIHPGCFMPKSDSECEMTAKDAMEDASGSKVQCFPMFRRRQSADDGVWRCHGTVEWWGRFYVYRIRAFHPSTGRLHWTMTPDPYSSACAADSSWSLVCHLPTWKEVLPKDVNVWQDHSFLPHQAEAAIYELHVRDFSMSDSKVPQHLKGKYLAFAEAESMGSQHLSQLAESGITHVQLLPTYDFGSVPERAADRIDPDTLQMTSAAADSEDPQEVTSVSLEGWESSLWMVKDVVITWFAGWFWF